MASFMVYPPYLTPSHITDKRILIFVVIIKHGMRLVGPEFRNAIP